MLRQIFFSIFFFSQLLFAQSSYIDYVSPFHPVEGKKGMVVSQNRDSSEIGIEILNMGGNAIDAAVAVGFSLSITLPRAGHLGGGGFMLIRIKDEQEIIAIDFRSRASENADLEKIFDFKLPEEYEFIDRDRVRYGYQASAVPGTVAGLLKAHELYGKLPLKKIMEPVLRQAKNGIVVSFDLHHAINSTPQLLNDRESKKIYFSGDSPVPINSKLVLDDLHQTLKLIAQKGKAGFYEGITAKRIASAMKQNNGFITSNDLKKYEAKVSKPISTKYRDKIIFTHGPPSGGGIALLSALNVIENYDFKIGDSETFNTMHVLAEAIKYGHQMRSKHVGDPDFESIPVDNLIDKNASKAFYNQINFSSKLANTEYQGPNIPESKDTTHFSIIDADGNAVSNTYTLGYSFGSGVTIPGTGILMNNQMNNFALLAGSSIVSREASTANRFKPGKKPMSTMAPVIVTNLSGDIFMITGSPGGSFIPSSILRVINGVIDFDLDIGRATMLTRINKDWPNDKFEYEGTLNADVKRALSELHTNLIDSKTMGSTQSIIIENGIKYGFADLRRPNAGVAIQN